SSDLECVRVRVLGQVRVRTHQGAGVAGRLITGVDTQIGLIQSDRLRDDQSVEVLEVLVPVTGREGGGVDRGLLVAPVDVAAAGRSEEAEHAEQRKDQERDQDDGRTRLQLEIDEMRWCSGR